MLGKDARLRICQTHVQMFRKKESLYLNYCLSVFIYTTFNYVRPSGRDTDDDDDPFTESKDEEDWEDNKTLLEDY